MNKISVITVCWNCVGEIEKTLTSVLAQTYSNMEYIVVDGASKDGTLEIINKYKNHISVLISEPDSGLYNAMNKGVKAATGQWCIFMNAGDMFASNNVLKEMFEIHRPNSCTKVYYGSTTYVYENHVKITLRAKPIYPEITRCQPYCHQSVFFNIEQKKEPFFDEKYKIASDYNTSLWYYLTYGKNAFEISKVLVSEYIAFGGVSTLEKNHQRMCLENFDIWKKNKICWKRYLIERIKYFIIYQQPIVVFKSLLKRFIKNGTIQDAEARSINRTK